MSPLDTHRGEAPGRPAITTLEGDDIARAVLQLVTAIRDATRPTTKGTDQ